MANSNKSKQYHFIYKTTNLLNGKYYIGMHSTNNLNDGYLGSGKRLKYSVNKHGKENFRREILEFVNSREELILREQEIVSLDEIAKKECMNLKKGGDGGFNFTLKERQEISKIANQKQNFLRANNSEWSQKESEGRSKRMREEFSNGKRDKKKFSYDWYGKKHKEESKQKISESISGKQKGNLNSQYGTRWITKEGINKKIKKEEVDIFIEQGWIKGRT